MGASKGPPAGARPDDATSTPHQPSPHPDHDSSRYHCDHDPYQHRALGQVTRRFPRHITPDQSPLLRQSLIQSTLLRAGEDDSKQKPGKVSRECHLQDSRSSSSVFTPVLSSTKPPQTIL